MKSGYKKDIIFLGISEIIPKITILAFIVNSKFVASFTLDRYISIYINYRKIGNDNFSLKSIPKFDFAFLFVITYVGLAKSTSFVAFGIIPRVFIDSNSVHYCI
ncbi:MAG: hypothetical protein ACRD8Z_03080 [Nitrososphaeraceae archaeon]